VLAGNANVALACRTVPENEIRSRSLSERAVPALFG